MAQILIYPIPKAQAEFSKISELHCLWLLVVMIVLENLTACMDI